MMSHTIARKVPLSPGSIVALDRGYFRRHQRKRPLYPDLDSIDNHAADQIHAVQIQNELVTVEPGGLLALEPVYL